MVDSRCIIMDAFELGREFPEVEIDPRLVFDNPTIEQLSQAIVDLPKAQRTKSVESATGNFQTRTWIFQTFTS